MTDLKKKVTEIRLVGANGENFLATDASASYSSGNTPGTVSVRLLSENRLLEVDGSDGALVQIEDTRGKGVIIPKPNTGIRINSNGWRIKVKGPDDEREAEIGPLTLTNATIERGDLAKGSLGKMTPDEGQERTEVWALSFADARIFWGDRGHLTGKRNVRDPVSTARVSLDKSGDSLELLVSRPEFKLPDKDKGERFASIEYDINPDGSRKPPLMFNRAVPRINSDFERLSVTEVESAEFELKSLKQLLEEVARRDHMPFLTSQGNEIFVGPPQVIEKLEKIFPLDIDYGERTSPGDALALLANRAGLAYGLTLDGRLWVDFEQYPDSILLQGNGSLLFQNEWIDEERGYKPIPRPWGYKFIPKRVIRQILLHRFEPIVVHNGEVQNLDAFLKNENLTGLSRDEIMYILATKTETQRVGEVDPLEELLTESLPKTTEATEAFNSLTTWGFKGWRYAPTEEEKQVVEAASLRRRNDFKRVGVTARPEDLRGEVGAQGIVPKKTLFDFKMVADAMLAVPVKIVEKVDGVGDLKPKFFSDLAVQRTYDFWKQGFIMTTRSFVETVPPPAFGPVRFFNPGVLVAQFKEHNWLEPDRSIADKQDAHGKANTFQADWMRHLSSRSGVMVQDALEIFWDDPTLSPVGSGGTEPLRIPPPVLFWATWISTDVTEYAVGPMDQETGVVQFRVPMGWPEQSVATRNMFEQSIDRFAQVREEQRQGILQGSVAGPFPNFLSVLYANVWSPKLATILEADDDHNDDLDRAKSPIDFAKHLKECDFRSILNEWGRRGEGVGRPRWTLSSLSTAIEREAGGGGGGRGAQFSVATGGPAGTTVAKKVGAAGGGGPRLNEPTVMSLVWAEAPYLEEAWPSFEIGVAPFAVVPLETPWVEDIDGKVLEASEELMEREVAEKQQELISLTALEESEEVTVPRFTEITPGAAIRNITLSVSEGASSPRTIVTGARTPTRKMPIRRTVVAVRQE